MKAIILPQPALILVVDDERMNRDLLQVMLSAEGFEVATAASGEEALAAIASRPPDLILLDVLMPGMNGHEVTRRVKSNLATKNIPVIMVTALDDRDARLFGLGAGAEDFLTKPLDRVELCMRVRNMLRLKASSDQALVRRDDSMGMVSHELRNVLSGLMLGAVLLESEGAPDTPDGRRIVDAAKLMQRQGKRMGRLIEDLVDVVRIDAGKLALKPTRCAAKMLLNEAVETCAASAAERGVALGAESVDAGLEADFDRERLLQVLTNLIGNALKFTPAGGSIALQATTSGADLHLAVTDTGVGIPEDLLGVVFERFRQVESDDRGLGLGLYICRCIVDSHGGRIWAESVPGVKTTFHVAIPGLASAVASVVASTTLAADDVPAEPEVSPSTSAVAHRRGPGRILVIDDDQAICETLAKYLTRQGFTTEWSTSPVQAIAMLSARDFDVIVTDLNMPHMDGIALTRHIGSVRPGLPVIVTSAFGTTETRNDALVAGAHRFMSKPYDLEVLFSELREAVTSGRAVTA